MQQKTFWPAFTLNLPIILQIEASNANCGGNEQVTIPRRCVFNEGEHSQLAKCIKGYHPIIAGKHITGFAPL